MPSCYTFNKMLLPNSGMDLCPGSDGSGCAATVTWFWWLAAAVGAGLVIANMGKN